MATSKKELLSALESDLIMKIGTKVLHHKASLIIWSLSVIW